MRNDILNLSTWERYTKNQALTASRVGSLQFVMIKIQGKLKSMS